MRLPLFLAATIVVTFASAASRGQNPDTAHAGLVESPALHGDRTITCPDIAAWINNTLRPRSLKEGNDGSVVPWEISSGRLPSGDLDCGAAALLEAGVHFELGEIHFELDKVFFDRTLHSWEFLLRCERLTDCVPFLVRWPRPPGGDPIRRNRVIPASAVSTASKIHPPAGTRALLRRGETVTLVWDQDGIRVVLPAICLEQGNAGESIRVRTKDGGRVFRAEIVNAFLLRVVL